MRVQLQMKLPGHNKPNSSKMLDLPALPQKGDLIWVREPGGNDHCVQVDLTRWTIGETEGGQLKTGAVSIAIEATYCDKDLFLSGTE